MMQVIGSNLSQWDVGRRLIVTDSNATHVHFANQGDSKAVIMEIQNEEVLIPDYLLQTGKQVMAYAVLDGITLEKKVFVVQKRERPENYIYDHDDRNYIYELINKAETAVNNANETLEGFKSAVESGEYNGITPHIGANENWFIGEEDTGKTSRGEPGYTPKKGVDYFTTAEVNAIVEEAASKASVGNIDLSKYAKKEDIPKKPEDIGADPKGTADTTVSRHNASADSHNDIRLALKAINDRLTAFFDSDDATLDELSEIVAYITSNKTLIEAITTSKVSVSDIVNNLTTNAANKPLSAAQGVVLKGLIDAVSNSLSGYALKSAIPTKVSQLTNDAGYLTQHQDISGKLDRTELPSAINTALAQAAESGEFDGADGRGIKSIVRTSGNGAAGTTDTYTITYTDNTTATLTVYNGKNGTNGTSVTVKSVSESTADGGNNEVTFSDGTTITIKNGQTGAPGKAPVKGVDYYTEADKTEMVNAVLSALPMWEGGSY